MKRMKNIRLGTLVACMCVLWGCEKPNVNIVMPQEVKDIIKQIEAAGFEAFAVGGCVRDCILGRTPQDWDITTSALPSQIKEIFAGKRVHHHG